MTQITSVDQPPKTFSELRNREFSPTTEQFLNSLRGHIEGDTFSYGDASYILRNFGDKADLSMRAQVVECCIDILENQMESHKGRNAILLLKLTLHEGEYDKAIDSNLIDKNLLGKIDISRLEQVLDSCISTAQGKAFDPKLDKHWRDALYWTASHVVDLLDGVQNANLDSLTLPRHVDE
jgi:hypothetical protein